MLNAGPVIVADVLGTTANGTVTCPVRTNDKGPGSERTREGIRAQLDVIRADTGGAAVVGNVGVYGFNLSDPNSGQPLGNAYSTPPVQLVQPFTADGATTSFTADQLALPAAVAPNAIQQNVAVETEAFSITATNATSVAAAATGIVTVTGGDLDGSTAAMVPPLPEVDAGDIVEIVGTVNGVAGVSVTGTVTSRTDQTHFVWDQTTVITAAYAINRSPAKRLKKVLATTAAGPRACNMNSAATAAPVVTFPVAPVATQSAERPAVVIYIGTPIEILASGVHMVEKQMILSRSVLWARWDNIQTAANRTFIALSHLVG